MAQNLDAAVDCDNEPAIDFRLRPSQLTRARAIGPRDSDKDRGVGFRPDAEHLHLARREKRRLPLCALAFQDGGVTASA